MRKIDLNKVVLSEFFDLKLLNIPFYIQIVDGKIEITDTKIAMSIYIDADNTLDKKYKIEEKPTKNSYIDFNKGLFYHEKKVFDLEANISLDIERIFIDKRDDINEISITDNGVKIIEKIKNLTNYIVINHYNDVAMSYLYDDFKCYFKLDREFKGNWNDYNLIIRCQYLIPYNHYIFTKEIYQVNKDNMRCVAVQYTDEDIKYIKHKLPQFNKDKSIRIDKNILNEIKGFKKKINEDLSQLNSCVNIHIENNQAYLYIVNKSEFLYYKKELGRVNIDNESFCIHYNNFINLLKCGDLYINYDNYNSIATIMICDNDIELYVVINSIFLGESYPRE